VILLIEEMHHVIVFLNWKADWWVQQGALHCDVSDALSDGLSAYAAKQSHMCQAVATKFACM
jgi:hypothetical protein